MTNARKPLAPHRLRVQTTSKGVGHAGVPSCQWRLIRPTPPPRTLYLTPGILLASEDPDSGTGDYWISPIGMDPSPCVLHTHDGVGMTNHRTLTSRLRFTSRSQPLRHTPEDIPRRNQAPDGATTPSYPKVRERSKPVS